MTHDGLIEADDTRLTSQNVHFPKQWAYASHQDHATFKSQLERQLFSIQDDILYSCITYGDGVKHTAVTGFTRSKDSLGYPLLAFFTSRALGLYRLPFCPDRAYEFVPGGYDGEQQLRALLSQLTPARVDSICAEVEALYAHTQDLLREAGFKKVSLKRNVYDASDGYFRNSVGYAELLFKLKAACELVGRDTLRFEMDVLNSYGDDGGYRHFPVAIRHDVPAEDILYCSNFIRSREHHYDGSPGMAVEDGEWVVINRASDGVIDVPVSAVELNHNEWSDHWERRLRDCEAAERFILEWEPMTLRRLSSLGFERRFHGGGLRLRPIARLYAALNLLRTGRYGLG